jgi:hypothetical protein
MPFHETLIAETALESERFVSLTFLGVPAETLNADEKGRERNCLNHVPNGVIDPP